MGWAEDRARLLTGETTVMSVDDVFSTLLERDATLLFERGQLRYVGPDHGSGDPLLRAIDIHRAILTELFTYVPEGRCVSASCYRLLAAGDPIACPDHRAQMDATPMPWEGR